MTPDQSNTDEQQMQRINIALEYTDGDIDKARQMVAGQHNDLRVFKCKFQITDTDTYGLIIIFLNIINSYIPAMHVVLLSSKEKYDKASVFDNWKMFYRHCSELQQNDEMVESNDIFNHIYNSIDGYDLYGFAISKDLEGAVETLQEVTSKFYNLDNVIYQIEMEDASSLAIREQKIPLLNAAHEEAEEVEDNRPEIEKEADFIIEGATVVSPVKGKYVNEVKKGDVIKVRLVSKEGISRKVAVALDAITDKGEFLPVKGRVKKIIPDAKGGHTIYCAVAKGIFAKILEEENVRIEYVPSKLNIEEVQKVHGSSKNLGLYLALLFGLIFITIIIIYVLV